MRIGAHRLSSMAAPRRALPPGLARTGTPAAGAGAALAATALLLALAGAILVEGLGMGWPLVPLALLLFSPLAALVWRHLGEHPYRRFGPANVVTMMRGGVAASLGALLWEYRRLAEGEGLLWALVAVALVTLLLDGLDGILARRTGLASPFGERFDMETDAFLILILSALVFVSGKAGAFVLLIGSMRYAFRLAARLEPRLRRPLPPAFRRKTVCVLQVVLLCVALLPPVEPLASGLVAGLALGLLAWSFAVDIAALLRPSA